MKKCLVVDDSTPVRKISHRMLLNYQFEVDEAVDGRDAMEKCQISQPDLILLDWNMPNMDGLEFLKAFRENFTDKKTNIIFCTTNNEPKHIELAIQNGADEYIMKPFDSAILEDKLRQLGLLD